MTRINVLFVCLGNICRSPMADAVFQHKVRQAGLEDRIRVDSAGTGSWHIGEKAHRGTLNILRKHNIPYEGRARQIFRDDFEQYDYILAMDRSNLHDLESMLPPNSDSEVRLFLSYANDAGTVEEQQVPDPYYSGEFGYVYDLVSAGCDALLNHIRQQHNL